MTSRPESLFADAIFSTLGKFFGVVISPGSPERQTACGMICCLMERICPLQSSSSIVTSSSARTVTSASRPTPRVPIRSSQPMADAGEIVEQRITSSKDIPRWSIRVITVGMS